MVDQRASQASSKAQAVSGPVPEKFLQFLTWTMSSVLHTRFPFFFSLSKSSGDARIDMVQTIFTMKMFFLAKRGVRVNLLVCVSNFSNIKWLIKGGVAWFSRTDCLDSICIPEVWWGINDYVEVWLPQILEKDLLHKASHRLDEAKHVWLLRVIFYI